MKATLRAMAPITVLLLGQLAAAEPFDAAIVAADARWVAHIDVDRAREAEGVRRLLQGHMNLGKHDLDRLQRRLGVDAAGLDGEGFSFICAYGSGDGHSETAIIGATPETIEWFASWMARAGEAQPDQQSGEWVVRSWRRHGRLTAMTALELAGGGRAMVIADSVDEVVAGAQVATGRARSLADVEESELRARPSAGSIVFLAAEGIDEFEGIRPRAVALRDAKRLVLDFGELEAPEAERPDEQADEAAADGGRMFLHATITAAGPEQAQSTRDVLGGLRAWGRMAIAQSERAKQCAPLLDAFELRVEGADVIVSWGAEFSALPAEGLPAEAPPAKASSPR